MQYSWVGFSGLRCQTRLRSSGLFGLRSCLEAQLGEFHSGSFVWLSGCSPSQDLGQKTPSHRWPLPGDLCCPRCVSLAQGRSHVAAATPEWAGSRPFWTNHGSDWRPITSELWTDDVRIMETELQSICPPAGPSDSILTPVRYNHFLKNLIKSFPTQSPDSHYSSQVQVQKWPLSCSSLSKYLGHKLLLICEPTSERHKLSALSHPAYYGRKQLRTLLLQMEHGRGTQASLIPCGSEIPPGWHCKRLQFQGLSTRSCGHRLCLLRHPSFFMEGPGWWVVSSAYFLGACHLPSFSFLVPVSLSSQCFW